MRRYARLLVTGLIGVSAATCERRVWTGPLASAADSMFPSAPTAGCDTIADDSGFDRVALPLRSCRSSRGDTTFVVLADGRRRVLILTRAMTVGASRQAAVHDSLQFAIGTKYEAPSICPQGADLGVTDVRIWKTLDRQIELRKLLEDRVVLELRVNHPGCQVGG